MINKQHIPFDKLPASGETSFGLFAHNSACFLAKLIMSFRIAGTDWTLQRGLFVADKKVQPYGPQQRIVRRPSPVMRYADKKEQSWSMKFGKETGGA